MLNNLYFSPNKIRMINSERLKWAEHVAPHEEKGKARRKGSTRKTQTRWKDNIKVDLRPRHSLGG
jgi:hypothetical protein